MWGVERREQPRRSWRGIEPKRPWTLGIFFIISNSSALRVEISDLYVGFVDFFSAFIMMKRFSKDWAFSSVRAIVETLKYETLEIWVKIEMAFAAFIGVVVKWRWRCGDWWTSFLFLGLGKRERLKWNMRMKERMNHQKRGEIREKKGGFSY